MVTVREIDDSFVIDFSDLEDYDDFDVLVEKLKEKFDVKIREKLDGPESRVWKLQMDGFILSLHNNPYGNYLKASSPEAISFLKSTIEQISVIFY
jgi:hypothetical protein